MIDLLPVIRDEIAAASAVDSIVAGRVAIAEPEPGWSKPLNEAASARGFTPFVVLVDQAPARWRRLPVQELMVAARCYGTTRQQAVALRGAVSDAVHDVGPRVSGSGAGIYISADEQGDAPELDPDTEQPVAIALLSFIGTTQTAFPE